MAFASFKPSVATLVVIFILHGMTTATFVNCRVVSTEYGYGGSGGPSSSPYSSPSSYYGEYGYSAPPPYYGGGYYDYTGGPASPSSFDGSPAEPPL